MATLATIEVITTATMVVRATPPFLSGGGGDEGEGDRSSEAPDWPYPMLIPTEGPAGRASLWGLVVRIRSMRAGNPFMVTKDSLRVKAVLLANRQNNDQIRASKKIALHKGNGIR